MRIKNYKEDKQDLIIETCYAPTDTAPMETMEEFWKCVCVLAKHQEFPVRSTIVAAGDFNGDVMPDEHDPLIGLLHPAKKESDNGARLCALAHTYNLFLPQTWEVRTNETDTGWQGETFFGRGRH